MIVYRTKPLIDLKHRYRELSNLAFNQTDKSAYRSRTRAFAENGFVITYAEEFGKIIGTIAHNTVSREFIPATEDSDVSAELKSLGIDPYKIAVTPMIYVHPDCQGRGVNSALYAKAMAYNYDLGYRFHGMHVYASKNVYEWTIRKEGAFELETEDPTPAHPCGKFPIVMIPINPPEELVDTLTDTTSTV